MKTEGKGYILCEINAFQTLPDLHMNSLNKFFMSERQPTKDLYSLEGFTIFSSDSCFFLSQIPCFIFQSLHSRNHVLCNETDRAEDTGKEI